MKAEREVLNGMALFAGAGGLELGVHLALGDAYRTVVYVEREAYAAASLVGRMEDQALDPAPVWDDVSTFNGRPWRGVVDLISGGFPCQDISSAGRHEGIVKGNRSGLWFEYARIIGEVGPRLVFVENVSALALRGLDIVLGTLADLGFDAEWLPLAAEDLGASHKRERIFILAHNYRWRCGERANEAESEPTGGALHESLRVATAQWLTPKAVEVNEGPESFVKRMGDRSEGCFPSLNSQAQSWPTPRTISGGGESAERKKELGRDDSGGGDLQAAVQNWQTPTVVDAKERAYQVADGVKYPTLVGQARTFPTPNARDGKGSDLSSRHGGASLSHFVETGQRSHQAPVIPKPGGKSSKETRRLNPRFVEWLMGWPLGWTDLGSAATESFRSWQRSHSELLRAALE